MVEPKDDMPALSVSPFMSLPQELRDMIYHELWQEIPAIIKCHKFGQDISVRYDGMRRPVMVLGLPQWLLASKAILNEGMSQFKRHAMCSLLDAAFSSTDDRENQDINPKISPLVDMSTASRFCVTINACHVVNVPLIRTKAHVLPSIQRLADTFGPNLRILSIFLDQYIFKGRLASPQNTVWRVYLPFPKIIDPRIQLQKLEVRLRIVGRSDTDAYAPGILAALEAELTGHGKLLVGETGKFEIKEIEHRYPYGVATMGPLAWIASYTKA